MGPSKLINEKIKFIKSKNFKSNTENKEKFAKLQREFPDNLFTFKLNYTNFQIEYWTRQIKKIIKSVTPEFQLNFIYTTSKLSSILLPLIKPEIDKFKKSSLVYKFECPCNETYIGETARELDVRIREHNQKS